MDTTMVIPSPTTKGQGEWFVFLRGPGPKSGNDWRLIDESIILTETNIACENWWLEDYLLFGKAYFQGRSVSFREGSFRWFHHQEGTLFYIIKLYYIDR